MSLWAGVLTAVHQGEPEASPSPFGMPGFPNIGGMFGGQEIPSGRFNGLEKLWFWGGLVLLGLVMSVTGLVRDASIRKSQFVPCRGDPTPRDSRHQMRARLLPG